MLLRVLLALLAVLAVTPQAASACIWKRSDGWAPFPPCEYQDPYTARRLAQLNAQLVGKLRMAAEQVRNAKKETLLANRSRAAATVYMTALARAHGDVEATPLTSMVVEYNRIGSDGLRAVLGAAGQLGFIQVQGDSTPDPLVAFRDSAALDEFYGLQSQEVDSTNVNDLSRRLEEQLLAIADYDTRTRALAEQLLAIGQEHAGRYEGLASADGLAEAKISRLAAALTRLRGTAHEAQARSILARIETLEGARVQQHSTMTRRTRLLGVLTALPVTPPQP